MAPNINGNKRATKVRVKRDVTQRVFKGARQDRGAAGHNYRLEGNCGAAAEADCSTHCDCTESERESRVKRTCPADSSERRLTGAALLHRTSDILTKLTHRETIHR